MIRPELSPQEQEEMILRDTIRHLKMQRNALREACMAALAHFDGTDAPLGNQLRAALTIAGVKP